MQLYSRATQLQLNNFFDKVVSVKFSTSEVTSYYRAYQISADFITTE